MTISFYVLFCFVFFKEINLKKEIPFNIWVCLFLLINSRTYEIMLVAKIGEKHRKRAKSSTIGQVKNMRIKISRSVRDVTMSIKKIKGGKSNRSELWQNGNFSAFFTFQSYRNCQKKNESIMTRLNEMINFLLKIDATLFAISRCLRKQNVTPLKKNLT